LRFLLDTNVVSELRKTRLGRAAPAVKHWASLQSAHDMFLSAISLMELELGVLLAERRSRPEAQVLRTWLVQEVIPQFGERVLPVDAAVARVCAGLHVPARRPDRDALIAATALVHGMTVVTRNVKDFASTGVAWLNPWE